MIFFRSIIFFLSGVSGKPLNKAYSTLTSQLVQSSHFPNQYITEYFVTKVIQGSIVTSQTRDWSFVRWLIPIKTYRKNLIGINQTPDSKNNRSSKSYQKGAVPRKHNIWEIEVTDNAFLWLSCHFCQLRPIL